MCRYESKLLSTLFDVFEIESSSSDGRLDICALSAARQSIPFQFSFSVNVFTHSRRECLRNVTAI